VAAVTAAAGEAVAVTVETAAAMATPAASSGFMLQYTNGMTLALSFISLRIVIRSSSVINLQCVN